MPTLSRPDDRRLIVCVAGSRVNIPVNIYSVLDAFTFPEDTLFIHGGARGADRIASSWAHKQGYETKTYPADWRKYKAAAGPIRNSKMATVADVLIAFWDGTSAGTFDMISAMKKREKPTYIYS